MIGYSYGTSALAYATTDTSASSMDYCNDYLIKYGNNSTTASSEEAEQYGLWTNGGKINYKIRNHPTNIHIKWAYEDCATTNTNNGWKIWCGTDAGTTASTWYDNDCHWHDIAPKTAQQQLAEIMRKRQSPGLHLDRKSLSVGRSKDDREERARETLRMIIGDQAFRRFLKSGFVTARNSITGYTYQIFHANHHLTHVYKDGKMVERLCIYLRGKFPPTDFVITMYLLALNNDKRIWEIGNKNGAVTVRQRCDEIIQPKSLIELYREIKDKVA